jgi:hypothetical protein
MLRPNTYESYAYEDGFAHGKSGHESPIKSHCDPFYWIGYQNGKGV